MNRILKAFWAVFWSVVVLVILIVLFPALIVYGVYNQFQKIRLLRRVEKEWLPSGKRILFVYSNSPHWKDYVEKSLLPKIADTAVVLNWSERSCWNWKKAPLEVEVFKHWASVCRYYQDGKFHVAGTEYNPLAIVFGFKKPKVFKFWQAFKDYKHGKMHALHKIEREFFQAINPSAAL